jgi:hypothetical protein
MTTGDPLALWRSNPFFVLDVATDATPADAPANDCWPC